MAPLQMRYTNQPVDFSTGLRSAVVPHRIQVFLCRPPLFRSPVVLKSSYRSQIWVSRVGFTPPPPPGWVKKFSRTKRTHQNVNDMSSKFAAAPELTRRVMGN